MDEQMMKSLVQLIDESLAEIEELKKSDRFSAQEIKLDNAGEEFAGHPTNGSLDKADDDKDDKKDEDEDEKKDKKEDKKAIEKKVDEHNEKKHGEDKDEDSAMKKGCDDDDMEKAQGTNEEKVEKSAKSEFTEELAKSYIDSRISPIESKLDQITSVLEKLADFPVPAKSASYKSISPLAKSDATAEVEPLSKAEVVNKLFELKKSGENVDSTDIAMAELSDQNQLSALADKYNLGV